MNLKLPVYIFYITIDLIMLGCVFHPDEDDNFKIVNSDISFPTLQFNLDRAADTILVSGPIEFNYAIEGVDINRPHQIIFYTGTEEHFVEELSGKFLYNPPEMTGFETLALRVFLKSGTGSLADKLGVEQIVYDQSWVMLVDTKAPNQSDVTISKIKPDKGMLKVEWPKYARSNFKSYRINKTRGIYSTRVITDIDSSFFYDTSFLGGESSYQLVIETKNGLSGGGPTIYYKDENVPSLKKYDAETSPSHKVYFSSSLYPNNVKRYEVYETGTSGNPGRLVFTTTNPKDTVFELPSLFGQPRFIYIKTVSKLAVPENGDYESILSPPIGFVYGEKTNEFETILFSDKYDRYFTIDIEKKTLSALAISTNQSRGAITLPDYDRPVFQVSQDQDQIIGLFNNRMIFWDVATLSVSKEIDLSSLLASDQYMVGFGITSDGRLLLSKVTNTATGYGKLIIYNPNSHTVIKESAGYLPGGYLTLSNDEIRVLSRGRISTIENNLISIGFNVGHESPIFFNPENQNQALYGSAYPAIGGSIFIKDISSFALISTISTPTMSVYSMDIDIGWVGGNRENSASYIVFDYKNQKIIWEGLVTDYYNMVFHGGYIYSRGGVRLKILK